MNNILRRAGGALLLAAVSLLAACGGGGGTSTSSVNITAVRVFGDSLADSGTFGLKFTVNAAGPKGTATAIWPELVAATYSKSVCNFYVATSSTNFVAPQTACGNYAVGGGRINSLANTGGPTAPYSIPNQMDTAAAVVGGPFAATELMLVDGGGNDAADLFGALLNASTPQGLNNYVGMLSTLVNPATVTAVLTSGPTGPAQAGGLYMQALANKFADDMTAKLLDRGAKRVVVLNAPNITNTPRFKMVLAAVAANAGTTTSAGLEATARAWVSTFNQQLAARLGSDARVGIADFGTEFDNQMANPTQFGLTNVAKPACPITGVGTDGLPTYDFSTCTAASLDALQPSSPGWWKTYAFSDGFHPTPYGHQLLAQLVARTLAAKGWL